MGMPSGAISCSAAFTATEAPDAAQPADGYLRPCKLRARMLPGGAHLQLAYVDQGPLRLDAAHQVKVPGQRQAAVSTAPSKLARQSAEPSSMPQAGNLTGDTASLICLAGAGSKLPMLANRLDMT